MKTLLITITAALCVVSCSNLGGDKGALPGDVVAKVGPQTITKAEFSKRMASIKEQLPGMYEGDEGTKVIVDQLVNTELLYLQAKKEGLDRNADYIAKVEDFRKIALVQMVFEKTMKDIAPKVKVTDEDVKAFYEKNKEKIKDPVSGKRIEYAKVKDRLTSIVEQQKQQEEFDKFVAGIRKEYAVTVNEEALKALQRSEEKAPDVKAPKEQKK